MRRKTKRLLATGMALAVLATNLMPVSLAAETAEELQTDEVAAQALTDEIDTQAIKHNHRYAEKVRDGFEIVNNETGEAKPYVVLKCVNIIGSCSQREITYHGDSVMPSSTTKATCTSNKVFHYSAAVVQTGGIWVVNKDDITVPNSKVDHKFTQYVDNTEATCTKDATEIAYCDYGCKTPDIRDKKGTKLGHNYSVDFAWTDNTDGTATATAHIECSRGDVDATTESVTITKENTSVAPGCFTPGKNVYTASVTTDDGKTFTSEPHEVTVPATGHSYGNSCDAQWDDSTYKTATLTWECDNEGCDVNSEGHFKSETLPAVEKVTKSATCTDTGRLLHEVSYEFGGETEYLRQTTTIPALGHDFTELDNDHVTFTFSADGKSATATIKCSRCDETKPADATAVKVTSAVTTEPGCTTVGTTTYTATLGNASATTTRDDVEPTGHFYVQGSTTDWNEQNKTAVMHFVCAEGDDEQTVPVQCEKKENLSVAPTCTTAGVDVYGGYGTYEFVFDGNPMSISGFTPNYEIVLPALGHSFTNYVYNGDATCGGDGTETAKCDRCDVTDTRTAVGTAGCDLHTVDGAKVCAVCGKVDGQPKLAAAEANADVNASTIGAHLVVRVGTLPTGRKVITVAFLNNDGQAVQMFGTQKVHVSLAQLKAALGDTEGTGFEHTFTRVNTANGEKQNVGFTVENGTVNFDAAFNGSTACILLVD